MKLVTHVHRSYYGNDDSTTVTLNGEFEIEVSVSHIMEALKASAKEEREFLADWMAFLGDHLTLLARIPDDVIAGMKPAVRQRLREYHLEQAARYEEGACG